MANRTKGLRRPIVTEINGHVVELLTVGHLALALHRRVWTIDQWERIGLIPRSPFILRPDVPLRRRRLYPAEYVRALRNMVLHNEIGPRLDRSEWPGFQDRVWKVYEEIVIPLIGEGSSGERATQVLRPQ